MTVTPLTYTRSARRSRFLNYHFFLVVNQFLCDGCAGDSLVQICALKYFIFEYQNVYLNTKIFEYLNTKMFNGCRQLCTKVVCIYEHVYACTMCIYTHYAHNQVFRRLFMCMCMCAYVPCVCTHARIYVCMYIHTHTHTQE